ncbi:MAG: protease pro-enzyme activation domain-containing protein [Acidimicrobiales bacterium]
MRRSPRLFTLGLLSLSTTLVGFSLATTPALASQVRVVVAGASPVAATSTVVHSASTTSFDVVLRQTNQSALSAYIASLSNTASPNYHHYLTPSEFAKDFGATSSSVARVRSYLAHYGLSTASLSKGHILLHVTGSTTDIARAFATPVETVRTSAGTIDAQFVRPATLPSALAKDVVNITGLSTSSSVAMPAGIVHGAHVTSHVTTPVACPSAGSGAASTPNALGGYTIQQQAQLYGLNTAYASGSTGVGQTIAIYELGQYDQSDLSTYFSCYGLSPSINTINVDGGPTGGYSEEATMDIEQAAALAPGATISVYQAPNGGAGPTDAYAQIADDNTASVVTTSWGLCEIDPNSDVQAEQAIFEQMAAQGQTMIASSGDSGSSDCLGNTDGYAPSTLAVDDPASQPFVTGVGGLTISSISPLVQSVWNSGASNGAGGGGVSTIWPRPSWQSAPGITAANTMRMVPDVSLMADPNTGFIEYFTGTSNGVCQGTCTGWQSIGGTSIGSPQLSAIVAVAAQVCATPRLGFINPALYAMASSGTGFVDVTSGNNNVSNVAGYSAGVGYDMASGLGSPNGSAFVNGLCQPKVDATKSSFSASSLVPAINTGATITAVLKSTDARPLANAALDVTASAASGALVINKTPSSATSSGNATYTVNTDSSGKAVIDVSTDTIGPVVVSVAYEGQTLYSATLNFAKARPLATAPGRAGIASLVALRGGFRVVVAPPASNGGSAITLYQYSINGGARWFNISKVSRSATVMNLAHGRTYVISVRARNARGVGAASAPRRVTTLV